MNHNNNSLSHHQQLFNSFCLVVILFIICRLGSHIAMGNSFEYFVLFSDLTVIATLAIALFFSKVKNIFTPFIWPIIIVSQLGFFPLWFSLGGQSGSVTTLYVISVIFYFSCDPYKRYFQIGTFVSVLFISILTLEYINPDWVKAYSSTNAHFLDTFIVVLGGIIMSALVFSFLRKELDSEQKKAEEKAESLLKSTEQAKENQELLVVLKDLQSSFFFTDDINESYKELLVQLLNITNSQYGFIGEVNNEEEADKINIHALIKKPASSQEIDFFTNNSITKQDYSAVDRLLEFVKRHGSYTISNKVPGNHPELEAILGFPIMYNNKMVGLVGVANIDGYKESLIEFLSPFLSTYGTIIQNIRLKRKQKEYEEELKAARDIAEQAVEAKAKFFTNISHELRTPLALIVGPISSILREAEGNINEDKLRQSLGLIQSNSNRMLQFITDIMDLAKLNSDKLELDKEAHNLFDFSSRIFDYFKIQTLYRNVNYQFNFDLEKEITVEFDSKKIEKIINNLLSNAFKYTKDQGEVILTVSEKDDTIFIKVQDNGVGIIEDDLAHVFDRFYQSSDKSKTVSAGTGVGLALAKQLAELHGFDIEVESIVDQKTCFSLIMPKALLKIHHSESEIQETTETTVSNEIDSSTPSTFVPNTKVPLQIKKKDSFPYSILVVEDNPDMRLFIKSVLEEQYNVDIAENGLVGLEKLQADPKKYDLVLTDLMMPKMDGFELLERVKSEEWGRHIPSIVLTAKTGEQSKLKALTIGVDEYLNKPFSVEELLIRSKNLINNYNVRKEYIEKGESLAWVQEENQETEDTPVLVIDNNKDKTLPETDTKQEVEIDKEKIEEARAIVLENVDNTEFSVDNLARSMATSKRQLYRFMKANTGLTPLNFIKEIRLQTAREILEAGKFKTVKEVSYSIGFMSVRHFSKNYLNRFGKKPSAYLK